MGPIGALDQGTTTLNMRSVGAVDALPALEQLVVQQTAAGGPVLLRDVATVVEGNKQQTQVQRMNGDEAVGLTVVKQSDANELQVSTDVKAKLEQLRKLLPEAPGCRSPTTTRSSRAHRSARSSGTWCSRSSWSAS